MGEGAFRPQRHLLMHAFARGEETDRGRPCADEGSGLSSTQQPHRRSFPVNKSQLELHGRRSGHGLLIRHREVGLLLQVQEKFGREICGKVTNHLVEFGHLVDIPLARDGDAVFGAFQLTLKVAEGFADSGRKTQRQSLTAAA